MTGTDRRVTPRSARKRGGRREPERPPPPPALPPGPTFPGDPSPDQRVESYLRERYGERVGDVTVVPLFGDASTRRYYRVLDAERASVLSLNPEPFEPESLPFLVIRNLMAGWGLPVPTIVDADGSRGILLQEDLGDLTLQECLTSAGPERKEELYRQALDQLVVLQREAATAPQRAGCFQIAFDFEKL